MLSNARQILRRNVQFSLRALFVVVGFCAISLATLRVPTILTASICYSLAWALVVAAVVVALNKTGSVRAYSAAFAIACAAHLFLSFHTREPQLIVTRQLFHVAGPLLPTHETHYPPPPYAGETAQFPDPNSYHTEHVEDVWQSLWSIGLGCVAGFIGIRMYRGNCQVSNDSNPQSTARKQ